MILNSLKHSNTRLIAEPCPSCFGLVHRDPMAFTTFWSRIKIQIWISPWFPSRARKTAFRWWSHYLAAVPRYFSSFSSLVTSSGAKVSNPRKPEDVNWASFSRNCSFFYHFAEAWRCDICTWHVKSFPWLFITPCSRRLAIPFGSVGKWPVCCGILTITWPGYLRRTTTTTSVLAF